MAQSLKLLGVILAFLSVAPPHGPNFWVIWASMICCGIAAFNGDRIYSLAAMTLAGMGLLLFSPISLVAIIGQAREGRWLLPFAAIVPFCFPIVAMIVSAKRVRIRRASTT